MNDMDREELNMAAHSHYEEEADFYRLGNTAKTLIIDAFKSGAEWMMGQSLDDRLTEEEREKIRELREEAALFADAESIHNEEMSGAIYLGRLMALDMIFGKECFKTKNDMKASNENNPS